MVSPPPSRRIFSLEEARQLLPQVRVLTSEAVARFEALATRAQASAGDRSENADLNAHIEEAIRHWAGAIEALGLQPKGLWLVDFDNGEGYYCWCYPEDAITHFHGYDEGFAGRMKIV